MKKLYFSLFLLLNSLFAFSSESDPWTKRKELLQKDPNLVIGKINAFTNQRLRYALDRLNRRNHSCNYKQLYRVIHQELNSSNKIMMGKLEKYIRNHVDMKDLRVCTNHKNSIYKNFKANEGFAFHVTSTSSACSVNIDNTAIGSDKFGHFFAQGWNYFRAIYRHGYTFEEALLGYGDHSELNYFGFTGIGVYSFADLVANYEGYKFWKSLTQYYDSSVNPYIICDDSKWKLNRSFDWSDYVHCGWDEGINPSYYVNQKLTDEINEEVEDLGFTIPASSYLCSNIIERYRDNITVLKHVLSPLCAFNQQYIIEEENNFFIEKEKRLRDHCEIRHTWYNIGKSIWDAIRWEIF